MFSDHGQIEFDISSLTTLRKKNCWFVPETNQNNNRCRKWNSIIQLIYVSIYGANITCLKYVYAALVFKMELQLKV